MLDPTPNYRADCTARLSRWLASMLIHPRIGCLDTLPLRGSGSEPDPVIALLLGKSMESLLGEEPKPGKRGPAPKLQQQLERVSQLPKARQRMVSEVIDSLLAQATR